MTRSGITLFTLALVLSTLAARTAPLDKEGCAKLKAEEAEIEQSGVRSSMGRGPEWAKANLPPEKLEQIRRLIEVEEQLLFRCHGKPLVNLPKDPDPDPAAREPDGKDGAKERQPAAKGPKAAKKKAALAKKGADDAKAEPPARTEAAAPKADATAKAAKDGTGKAAKKAKARHKAEDAYRAPANPGSGANPFAAN
jgi:hypothetical protein